MTTDKCLPAACSVIAALAALIIPVAGARAQALPTALFDHELKLSTSEGHAALKWKGDREALVYALQSAPDAEFTEPSLVYEGGDQSSFQSGLADGRYYYRVRARELDSATWGPWSDPVEVVCKHHSFALAWTLFASGGLLFLLIVLFVGVNAFSLDRFERNDA